MKKRYFVLGFVLLFVCFVFGSVSASMPQLEERNYRFESSDRILVDIQKEKIDTNKISSEFILQKNEIEEISQNEMNKISPQLIDKVVKIAYLIDNSDIYRNQERTQEEWQAIGKIISQEQLAYVNEVHELTWEQLRSLKNRGYSLDDVRAMTTQEIENILGM